MMNKIWKFLTSFKLAIVLFILIATYSIIGTILPQEAASEFYIENYNTFGNIIVLLQFNKVYSSLLFRIILLVFLINLIGCTLNLLPSQIKKLNKEFFLYPESKAENLGNEKINLIKFKADLEKKGYKIVDTDKGFKAGKHRIGILGSSVTHLGIVIIILGSFIGNIFAQEGFIYLLPGESYAFQEEGFILKLDDFYLSYREDGSTEQYYSDLKISESGKETKAQKIWVNSPLNYKGLNFYQSSFGWVSDLKVKDKEGNILVENTMRNNQEHFYQSEDLTIFLYGFYPDFGVNQMGQPYSLTQKMLHPHYAVELYESNNYIDSYILESNQPIKYKDLEIEFGNSRMYTELIYRKDFGYYFVLLGCLIMLLGLLLSFYLYPKFIIVDGQSIFPVTRQNSWGFGLQIKKLLQSGFEIESEEI